MSPLEVDGRFPERETVVVFLVQRIQVGEVLHGLWRDDSDVVDETCHGTCRVGAPGEAEAEDLVAWLVVEDDEVVRLDHVAHEPYAEAALSVLFSLAELSGTNARVVEDNLLPDSAIGILAAAGDGACKPGHVGGDVFESRYQRLPSAIATDDQSLGCHRNAGINEAPLSKASLGGGLILNNGFWVAGHSNCR